MLTKRQVVKKSDEYFSNLYLSGLFSCFSLYTRVYIYIIYLLESMHNFLLLKWCGGWSPGFHLKLSNAENGS